MFPANALCPFSYWTTNLFISYRFVGTIYMSNSSNELQILFPDLTLAFYIYPLFEMKKFYILTE